MSNATLEHGLREALFRQHASAATYDQAREALRGELVAGGMGDGEIAAIFETFERGPMPSFDNTGFGRPAMDHALRNRVSPAAFTRFVTALKTFRGATGTAARMQETAFAVAGAKFVDKVVHEAEQLRGLREDVMAIGRSMNPAVGVDTLYRLVGDDDQVQAGAFDPLRRVAAVALDPTEFDPRQAAYREMWKSLTGLLSERERQVLEGRFGDLGGRGAKDAVQAFVAWASPAGRRKPDDDMTRALAPFKRFFDRVANAARGRGFQTVEDIWRRARAGNVAKRDKDRDGSGILAPDRYVDRDGHAAMKASLGRLTAAELAAAIRVQDTAIFEARKARASVIRALFDNAVARGARGALHVFDGAYEDTFRKEDRRFRALQRGRAMLITERIARTRQPAQETDGRGIDGPGPAAPPPGGGPGPRGFAATAETLIRPAANDDHDRPAAPGSVIDGTHGRYTVNPREGAHNQYVLSVDAGDAAAKTPAAIGVFGSKQALHAFVDAVDATRPAGGASGMAGRLATLANAAPVANNPNADVDVIRQSGFLDHRLDSAVASRDMSAFAFPLTTGDIVWQEGDGQWRAGSFDEFRNAAARRRDQHLTVAATAIMAETAARRADERLWLDVPGHEEAAAVAKGAQWDPQEGRFYAPDKDVVRRTAAWAPSGRGGAPMVETPASRPDQAPAAAAFSTGQTYEQRRPDLEASISVGRGGIFGARGGEDQTIGESLEATVAAAKSAAADVGDIFKAVGAGAVLALSGATGPKLAHVVQQLSKVPDEDLIAARRGTKSELMEVNKTIAGKGRSPELARKRLDLTGRMMAYDAAMTERGLRDPGEAVAGAAATRQRPAAESARER